MKLLNCLLIIALAFTPLACSEGESPQDSENAPSIAEIEQETAPQPETAAKPSLPELSPEEKEKSKNAPPGMVFIKGGCFTMGNNGTQEDEKWEHEVCLKDFYLDKYEVTQKRWTDTMGYNPSKFQGDDLPVEQVNYNDIQKFLKKTGDQCRLPTEAEWEYAVRGGTKTRYYWGNLMNGEYAWFEDNAEKKTHPVGQKKPNPYGLYDMMGNVWEWTADWYAPNYLRQKEVNPTGPGNGEFKVIRGGALDSSAGALRSTNRTWVHPQNRVYSKVTTYGGIVNELYNFIGFRCARSIAASPKETPQKEASSK